jgi:hypothetical protein
MLTVIYCTRKTNPEHKEHLIKSSGLHKHIEVIEIINNGESLTKAYNRGLKQAQYKHVVFCHDDITIETKQWGVKLLKQFEKNPEYAIIGVAGSKNMPVSGQWWENPKKMYGRVQHTHEGKSWLSSYSDDLGHDLEEVVNVDGVFFAVDITKLEKGFNENVEGFHFYDVTFCFENYLAGAKIGVSTVVRINHQSIGMTNEQWEANRVIFAETFKDNLPVNIKRVLRKGEKLKILFGSLSLNQNTIREQIIIEIATNLKKLGHDITVTSSLGGPLMVKAKKNNIKMVSIQEPPGFKLGDGKWLVQTQNGPMPSVEKTLYKMSNINFDILHVFNDELIDHFIKIYGDNTLINNNFIDGLIVNNNKNELVAKTISMKTNLELITNEFIDNLLKQYNEVL